MSVRQYVAGVLNTGSTGSVAITTTGTGATIVAIGFSVGGIQSMAAPTATGLTFNLVYNAGADGIMMYHAFNVTAGTYTINSSVSGFCSCVGPNSWQLVAYELDAPTGGGNPLDQSADALCTSPSTNWTGSSVTTTTSPEIAISQAWSFVGPLVNASLAVGPTWSGGTLHDISGTWGSNIHYGTGTLALSSTGSVKADFTAASSAGGGSNDVWLGLGTFKSAAAAAAGNLSGMLI